MQSITDLIKPIELVVGGSSEMAETGKGCFMNVIAFLNGEKVITDRSPCVCVSLRRVLTTINDNVDDRARLLPFIERAMGSATSEEDVLTKRIHALLSLSEAFLEYLSDSGVKGSTSFHNTMKKGISIIGKLDCMDALLEETKVQCTKEDTLYVLRPFLNEVDISSKSFLQVKGQILGNAVSYIISTFFAIIRNRVINNIDLLEGDFNRDDLLLKAKEQPSDMLIAFLNETLPKEGSMSSDPLVVKRAEDLRNMVPV